LHLTLNIADDDNFLFLQNYIDPESEACKPEPPKSPHWGRKGPLAPVPAPAFEEEEVLNGPVFMLLPHWWEEGKGI